MSRKSIVILVLGITAVSLGGLTAACGGGGEADLIGSFFRASRYDDRGTLGNMAMVSFDPAEDGTATGVSVESVTEEQSRPLQLRTLVAAVAEAQASEQEFAAEKKLYQDENFEAITRVLEAERETEDVARRDEEVQTAWTTWRDETMEHARSVSDARSALNNESLLAEVSASDPNNPIDVQQYEGELVTKDVVVSASIELDGTSEDRTMTITMQRVILENGETPIVGRWIITNLR